MNSLPGRFALNFVVLAAVLLGAIAVLWYWRGSANLRAAAVAEVVAKGIEKEAQLDMWLGERLSDIDLVSRQPDVVEKAARVIDAAPGSGDLREARAALHAEFGPYLGISDVNFSELSLLHPQSGTVILSTSPGEEGRSKSGHSYYENGRQGLVLQAPAVSAQFGAEGFVAAAPLLAADGRLVAVIAGLVDLGALQSIAQRRSGLHETEDAFVVNERGYLLSQPRFMTLAEPVVLQRRLETEAVRRCIARNTGVLFADDYRGVRTIAAHRWVAARKFGLIVKLDEAEALRPLDEFRYEVMVVSGLALLGAAGTAFFLARTITRPLHALQAGVRRFADRTTFDALPETGGDEVGSLAREFNQMAARVAERTADLANANQALGASMAKLNSIFRTAPMGIGVAADRTLLEVNEFLCRMLGYSREDLVGREARFLYATTEDYESAGRQYQEIHDAGCNAMETRFRCRDGRIVDVAISAAAIAAENPSAGVVFTVQDITERKRAGDELRRAHAQLADMFEHSPVITYRHRVEGPTIVPQDASGNFTRLLGFTKGEAKSMAWWQAHLHPDDRERALASISELMTQGTSRTEYRIRHQDGRYLWMDDTRRLVRDAEGNPAEIFGAWIDITERKQADSALQAAHRELVKNNEALLREFSERRLAQQAQQRLMAILEATPDFVGFADARDGHILHINKAGRLMCGIGESEDVTNTRLSDMHPSWAKRLVQDEILPTAAHNGYWIGECAFLSRDGREIPLDMVAIAHKSPTGEVEILSTISRDITERKRVEAQLKAQAQKLSESNQQLTRFNRQASGRELHVIKLKQEVNELAAELGYSRRYPLAFLDAAGAEVLRTTPRPETRTVLEPS